MNEVLLESGPTLLGSFLQQGLIDELIAFIAPKMMGSDARPLALLGIEKLDDAPLFKMIELKQSGDDIMARYLKAESSSMSETG